MTSYKHQQYNKDGWYYTQCHSLGIRGTIHKATTTTLLDLKTPTNKVIETFSQISIRYLAHIILNKRKS